MQPLHLRRINGRLATAIDAPGLGRGNPFQLPLAAQVGFKFREHPQHVQKRFPGRTLGIDRLLGGPEGDTTVLQQVAQYPGGL